MWQGWSCLLVHCSDGNATDPIWRVLASSNGIPSWTPLKPQHRNPTLTLWPINSGVLLVLHLSSSLTDSLPSLNLLCWFMQDSRKAVWSIPYISVASFFPSLKQNSKCHHCIFEIHQLWQSGFNKVYSSSCCSCSFDAETITIGLSFHKMYSNNILNRQESTTILNARTKKKSGNLLNSPCRLFIAKAILLEEQ